MHFFCHFLVSYPALILQTLAPAVGAVSISVPGRTLQCQLRQCSAGGRPPAAECAAGTSQGVSSARKRGIWAGREICIPAGCVIFPSGPAKLNPLAGLPAFLSDGWFELHLQLQSCLLYNTSGELKFLCGPHDPVQ